MIARIPPGALRRRAGFIAIAAVLGSGVFIVGGQMPAQAATQGPHASGPMAIVLAATQANSNSTPPSVDVTFKNRNPPKYPAEAIKKGEQGEVLLEVTIDAAGHVNKVAVDPKMTTAPVVLQTAALQAAANWKFAAGMKDGHPVGGVVKIPVNFSLSGWNPSGKSSCPEGFRYRQGEGKSFSCIARSSAPASS